MQGCFWGVENYFLKYALCLHHLIFFPCRGSTNFCFKLTAVVPLGGRGFSVVYFVNKHKSCNISFDFGLQEVLFVDEQYVGFTFLILGKDFTPDIGHIQVV
jgi:hypothetical protein